MQVPVSMSDPTSILRARGGLYTDDLLIVAMGPHDPPAATGRWWTVHCFQAHGWGSHDRAGAGRGAGRRCVVGASPVARVTRSGLPPGASFGRGSRAACLSRSSFSEDESVTAPGDDLINAFILDVGVTTCSNSGSEVLAERRDRSPEPRTHDDPPPVVA